MRREDLLNALRESLQEKEMLNSIQKEDVPDLEEADAIDDSIQRNGRLGEHDIDPMLFRKLKEKLRAPRPEYINDDEIGKENVRKYNAIE
jgi:hypothetical protein